MPKKLTIFTATLLVVLGTATPAVAQDPSAGDGGYGAVPDCAPQAGPATPQEEQPAAPPVPPEPGGEDVNDPSGVEDAGACPPVQQANQAAGDARSAVPEATAFDAPASCGDCGVRVVEAARDILTGGGSGTSPDPTDAFGAALQAARDAGDTREAAASEEDGTPVEDTPAYQAAFEAAREAGADDATAKEAAEQAVAGSVDSADGAATGKASKAREGGSGEGAAGEDKTQKDQTREDQVREEATATDDEETAGKKASTSGEEDGGTGGGEATTTPTGSSTPLLLGGVSLLSAGGYASLRFARSWSSVRGRKLFRN